MSRTFVIVIVLFRIVSATDDELNTSLNEKQSGLTDEHKILLECQHSDYRTYIKCLKRQKRHHGHGDHLNETGGTKTCFEDCGMDLCTSTKCVHDCHTRCMKRTKETRQIITQYETECGSDDCSSKAELPTTNITTNIDINNVINNHIPKTTSNGDGGGGNGGGGGGNGGGGGTVDKSCGPGTCGPFGGYGLTLVPQIQMVPQITFGIGIGPIGGCLLSMAWPCLQQPMQPTNHIDCSQCGNPFLKYRCDASCYPTTGSNLTCRAPYCVGGTN